MRYGFKMQDVLPSMLDVQGAKKELLAKSLLDIERATASTWGSRAAACYQLAAEARDDKTRNRRMQEAVSYRGEALEHAAMTEDLKFLQDLLRDIKTYQHQAESKTTHVAGA